MTRSQGKVGCESRSGEDWGRIGGVGILVRRRELCFLAAVLFCVFLLLFAWQQNRGLHLASEVARLEAREESLGAGLLELGAEVSRLHQPEYLMAQLPAADQAPDLTQRVVLSGSPLPRRVPAIESGRVWLASLGFEVPAALAAKSE